MYDAEVDYKMKEEQMKEKAGDSTQTEASTTAEEEAK